ncbi:MAG: hypothetical protein ABIL25_10075, partial [candidate division WOR-3 bacterium]
MKVCRISLLVLVMLAGSALAVTYYSTNGGGNWSDASKWSPSGVPNSNTDDVVIQSGHPITLNGSYSIRHVTINSGATFTVSSAVYLYIYGDWTNNGTATWTNGYADFRGSAAQSIGGNNPTTFYYLYLNKDALANTVTMNQAVTVSAAAAGALDINVGTLSTNGNSLTVNSTNASVTGDGTLNGQLDINTGGTTTIYNLDQSNTATGLGTVSIGPGTTVNITMTHTIGRYSTYNHTCNISGGTVNYNATGANVNLSLWLPMNTSNGVFATGGTITFYGTVQTTYSGAISATGSAVVKFAGSQSSYYNTSQNSSGGTQVGLHTFADLRIEKTGGASLTFRPNGSVYLNGDFTASKLTVNSGAVFILAQNYFASGRGYVLGDVTNNGTITIDPADNGFYRVSGDWTGNGVLNAGTKLVELTGTATKNLAGGPFYDLTVNRTGGGAVMTGNVTVQRNLLVSAGTFATGDYTLTLGTTGAWGSVTVASGAAFNAVGTGFGRAGV